MPKGPRGEKRPAESVANAVMVAHIAIGEVEDTPKADDGKDKAAQAQGWGSAGGQHDVGAAGVYRAPTEL